MFVLSGSDKKIPIKVWLEDVSQVESGTLNQATNLANLPFAFKHIALMPDCHTGYGMPIGGVLATTGNIVIPNAVGVDIGCGMSAVRSTLYADTLDQELIKRIFGGSKDYKGGIRSAVPVGFSHHSRKQYWEGFDRDNAPTYIPIIKQELESAKKQIGTLGGGNHFIELQKGDVDNRLWIMVHSGSRNFGLKIANEYNKKAVEHCKRWHTKVPISGHDGLAFLPLDTEDGIDYWHAMEFALEFAYENRKMMLVKIMDIVAEEIHKAMNIYIDYEPIINIHHNYARKEHHFGQNVIVHRKGATSAKMGDVGIIPGSQGTKSYIVRGLGNPESFESCSHGAGRRMGRKQARRELDLEAEKKLLDDKGIIHSVRHEKDLDEAPSAYKNIDVVMENQKDLVDIEVTLEPLAVIKG